MLSWLSLAFIVDWRMLFQQLPWVFFNYRKMRPQVAPWPTGRCEKAKRRILSYTSGDLALAVAVLQKGWRVLHLHRLRVSDVQRQVSGRKPPPNRVQVLQGEKLPLRRRFVNYKWVLLYYFVIQRVYLYMMIRFFFRFLDPNWKGFFHLTQANF